MVFVGQMSSHLDGGGNTTVNVCFASYWPQSHPNGYEMVSLEGKCEMFFETLLNVSIVTTQTQRTVKAALALFLCDMDKQHGKICCKNNYWWLNKLEECFFFLLGHVNDRKGLMSLHALVTDTVVAKAKFDLSVTGESDEKCSDVL